MPFRSSGIRAPVASLHPVEERDVAVPRGDGEIVRGARARLDARGEHARRGGGRFALADLADQCHFQPAFRERGGGAEGDEAVADDDHAVIVHRASFLGQRNAETL